MSDATALGTSKSPAEFLKAIKGKQVRLGVQADRNTIVHREEVYQKIQKEIREAMTADLDRSREAGSLLKGLHNHHAAGGTLPLTKTSKNTTT
jgi:sRNA-binding carbon storage regulator CsrA